MGSTTVGAKSLESDGQHTAPHRASLPAALAVGGLLATAPLLPQAWAVWSQGRFIDPDDAMRAVELREFLAGQAWFDLVPHRLSPDHPFVMHWSRLVDAPLGLMVRVFGLVLPAMAAERLMLLVAPAGLFLLALWTMLRLVRTLVGPRAMLPAALLLASSSEVLTNFMPGHIHHHGLQVTLLLIATAALLQSIRPHGRAVQGFWAGALAVLSLGVGLQNLPFVLGLAAVAVSGWIVAGSHQARNMAAFGFGLGAGSVPVFLLDVPPRFYGQGACDAFSVAHLLFATATGAVALGLAAVSPRISGLRQRFVAAGFAGAAVVALIATTYPACLNDPMAGVDPLLRDGWLSGVGEALPLVRLLALSPGGGFVLLMTMLSGFAATALAAVKAPSVRKGPWAALLFLAMIGGAGTFWQVRVAASACALMIPGLAWLVMAGFDRLSRRPRSPALLIAVTVGIFGNGAGWSALALPLRAFGTSRVATSSGSLSACFDPASFATLAALPPGLVLSTIDPGSAILAYTTHKVLAAPYHRNTYGNRVSLLALAAAPEDARSMLRDAKVSYLALCRFSNETDETVAHHPGSLSAALLAGRVPAWLTQVSGQGETFLLFQVD